MVEPSGTSRPIHGPLYAPAHPLRLWFRQDGSGPPVVLLHGLGDTHDLWRHQIPALAERYRVVAIDLRGHGRSPLGATPFDLDAMADDVGRTIGALELDQPIVVGLSMGGGVAQTLAIRTPGRLRAPVLVSTSSEFPDATPQRFLGRAALAEREGVAAVVDATVSRWFTPAFAEHHPDEVERTRRTVLAIDPAAFAAASRANADRNLTADLRSSERPVLFVGGAADPADPARALAIYRRELADLQWQIIPDTSHLVPVEAPHTFTDILLRFLGEVEQGTQRRGGER
jgi:3-oxoadipate enol-lactonase